MKPSFAWAQMYVFLAVLVQHFDFKFPDAKAEDFVCVGDRFAILTRGDGVFVVQQPLCPCTLWARHATPDVCQPPQNYRLCCQYFQLKEL